MSYFAPTAVPTGLLYFEPPITGEEADRLRVEFLSYQHIEPNPAILAGEATWHRFDWTAQTFPVHDDPSPCLFCTREIPCECAGQGCMCSCGRCGPLTPDEQAHYEAVRRRYAT